MKWLRDTYQPKQPVVSDEEILKDIKNAINENLSISNSRSTFSDIVGIEELATELVQLFRDT